MKTKASESTIDFLSERFRLSVIDTGHPTDVAQSLELPVGSIRFVTHLSPFAVGLGSCRLTVLRNTLDIIGCSHA